MSTDESRRQLLHDAARNAWGAEAALALMEMLPPTGWADVATRRDLEHLELKLDAKLARTERRIIQWNVATLIATAATMTAVVRIT